MGDICEISANTELLDLASGKGELLCQWAARHDAVGTGIEINDTVEALADGDRDRFGTLSTLLDRAENGGFELVEMVLANTDTWDRDEATQWKTVDVWLRENPGDPDAEAIRKQRDENRRTYLRYGRRYFGWGVFVFRQQRNSVSDVYRSGSRTEQSPPVLDCSRSVPNLTSSRD